ncbi:MAG: S53 family peptidase [Acidimicrobiales bacterium]
MPAALCVVASCSAGQGPSAQGAARPPGPATAWHVGVVPLVRWPGPASASSVYDPDQPFTPQQIRTDYSMNALYANGLTGQGETIGIVDAYGSPTIKADLASFDRIYSLPSPPSFKVVQPAGKVPPFNPDGVDRKGWAAETTLDVEWCHVMAPGASIVLAETPVDEVEGTSGFPQIVKAEKALIDDYHVAVISQSFGATEETFPTAASLLALRSAFVLAYSRHVTVLAASGDQGASGGTVSGGEYSEPVIGWPASDPLVTAVGGTAITVNSQGQQTAPPQVWNDSAGAGGGGVSESFPLPSWQDGVRAEVGAKRGIPDVSMLAACDPGVGIYESFSAPAGVESICGTSLATPLFAGVVAVADQLHSGDLGLLNPALYKLGASKAKGLRDVTRGNNSVTTTGGKLVVGYAAAKGYDLASGWGTIDAFYLVQELAAKTVP